MSKSRHRPRRRIRMGEDVDLVRLDEITQLFDVPENQTRRWLKALGVPAIAIGRYYYFNYHSLKHALHLVTQVGAPGFVAVGSTAKKEKRQLDRGMLVQIEPSVLDQLMQFDPDWQIRKAVRESLLPSVLEQVLAKVQTGTKSSPSLKLIADKQKSNSGIMGLEVTKVPDRSVKLGKSGPQSRKHSD